MAVEPFDYLFSISNDYILPESILDLPRRCTINYHDGPLPAYAGVHATFWALINQEKEHAITWHIVDAGIDTGPILKQHWFPVEPDETSIGLNIKCYSAALAAFRELADELASDQLVAQPQDLSRRTYFGRKNRPDTLFDFRKPAAETARLVRALNFGFHTSPFGFLKIRLGNDFFQVKELIMIDEAGDFSANPPGTITAIEPNELRVATGSGLLCIRSLTTLSGKPVSFSELTNQFNLKTGLVLTQPDDSFRREYLRADSQLNRHQAYWLEKYRTFSPSTVSISPSQQLENKAKRETEWVHVCLHTAIETLLDSLPTVSDKTDRLLTAFLLTVGRLASQQTIAVGYAGPESREIARKTGSLFADCVPFVLTVDWETGFEHALAVFRREQSTVENRQTVSSDRPWNESVLSVGMQDDAESLFPIIICRSTDKEVLVFENQPLVLVVSDDATCRIAYSPASWQADQVAELINRWLILLEKLLQVPTQPLKTVDLLTSEERNRMLVDWNAKDVPYPRHQPVHYLVEEQAQERPQAVALRCGPNTLTYGELNQRANQLARYLQKQGVEPGTLVGLCAERSPAMIISLLAILKTGGAYVPLDPSYPPARLAELCRQTHISFILTQQKWLDHLPTTGVTYLILDNEEAPWESESVGNPAVLVGAGHLAYVLFTSGSTGKPKNVAIPHRGIVRLVKGANYAQLDENTVMLGLAPLSFDASTLEIWGSLTNGGELVLITENRPTFELIKHTVQNHQVNSAFFTTALFNVLIDTGIEELTTLSQIIMGGEAASAEHVRRAQRQMPFCTFINGYGPTESTTFASYFNLSASTWENRSVPIGKPLSNTRLYVVDSFFNPVPPGVPGELLIGGDGLAREYLFQPELTREKFVLHSFSNEPEQRLYRTGDQARFQSDGTIEFLGRLDDQLKMRGFRIEPGEIEHALLQHPGLAEAVVLAIEPAPGQKMLAAYVVPRPGANPDAEVLRTFLRNRLPNYLIPTAFCLLKELPLTDNGKLDKKRLPPVLLRKAHPDAELSPTETALLPLWSAVLNQPDSSREDNFFELGGSSILAMQLIARIHQQFGRLLSLKDLFEFPTIQRLSAFLDQNSQPGFPHLMELKTADFGNSESAIPLSFAQTRLWIIHQLHELRGTYNVPIILKINGLLDLPVLQQSLEEVVRRHQILRTTFSHSDGVPFQRISASDSVPVLVSEWNGREADWLDQWLNTEAYQPFDLETGPLLRVRVASLGDDSWFLLLVFHHIIYDGWSTRVLANELSRIYSSLRQGQPVALLQLPLQYADFARWQLAHFTPSMLQRELVYWKNRLAGAPYLLDLPIDKPRPAVQSFEGADYSFHIPADRWPLIRQGLQEPGTTVFLRLLTVFSVWLYRVTRNPDVVVGIPVAGRNRSELVNNIGFFVNTLALRIEIQAEDSFRTLLRKVRDWMLEAFDHQDLPFEQVVEALKLPRTLAHTPLVQAIFDFQDEHSKDWQLDDLQVEPLPFVQHTAKFDLHLSFRELAGGVEGTFNYRTDLFNSVTIEKFSLDFTALLETLALYADVPFSKLEGKSGAVFETLAESPNSENLVSEEKPPLPTATEALVEWLRTTWSALLKVPDVGLDDDFFEIGGHSLLAFQLTTELQRQLGHAVSVGAVFANPTIRKLVIHLETAHPERIWQSLVAVQPKGRRPPLYCVHPISGDIGYAYQLVPYLSDDQPVYGLQAVGLDGRTEPFTSLEDMAAYYVKLILEQQPNGPYRLCGYSMGGIVAFEMAHQLKKIGKDVDLLALIDSYPVNPHADNPNQIPMGQLLTYYYHYWRSLPKHPGLLWRFFQKKAPLATRYFLNRLKNSLPVGASISSIDASKIKSIQLGNRLVASSLLAYSKYLFKPYDGKVVLLRAAGNDNLVNHRHTVKFGWDRYARQGVDVHFIPGLHETLFADEGTIAKMGAVLTAYLKSAV
ncbi:hypothetical protein GCM10028804_16200 [Larkinella terrae]